MRQGIHCEVFGVLDALPRALPALCLLLKSVPATLSNQRALIPVDVSLVWIPSTMWWSFLCCR